MSNEGEDTCYLEVSLGGYRLSLRELMRIQGAGKLVLKLPEQLVVDIKFFSISFCSGIGTIEGDELVVRLRESTEVAGEFLPECKKSTEESDKENIFSELERIYRKLSVRKGDK